MAGQAQYRGVLFPNRAESLAEDAFSGYRVFLDFWEPLADRLRPCFESLTIRRDSSVLLVHGDQGAGKTLFVRKLVTDYERTPSSGALVATRDNLWHRIVGGAATDDEELDDELIVQARASTSLIVVTNERPFGGVVVPADADWLNKVVARVSNDASRRWVVIIDNAERSHFLQSLVQLSDADFVRLASTPELIDTAAQRFVGHARTSLRGCLFILLTNNERFAVALTAAFEAQHRGMLARATLPLPGPREKETVVRVNINRLNPISYWYCLDRAGPAEKTAVHDALTGADTFPASFAAVDTAIKSSNRQGRRARQCLISLVVLSRNPDRTKLAGLGHVWRQEVDHGWLTATSFDQGWAQQVLPNLRDALLLESEWHFRLVVMGEPFVSSLLSGDPTQEAACLALLQRFKVAFGPGTHHSKLDANRRDLESSVDRWPTSTGNTNAFWAAGQGRSTIYEPVLGRLLGAYNQGCKTFLTYRPDHIVEGFTPCSVLSARSSATEDINEAIKREAHVFEFTAIESATADLVNLYLASKLPNYVDITREQ